MAASLICSETASRVSSVLNRDVKQFGKKFMFDSNEETCWNSDQGDTQWVVLEFPQPVKVSEVKLQFQGGFSGKTCRMEDVQSRTFRGLSQTAAVFWCMKEGEFEKLSDLYPEDNNSMQVFPIQEVPVAQKLKIVFENSTDFFGRIIVYSLDILGERA